MPEKPIHVQVAEVLGWTEIHGGLDDFYVGTLPEGYCGVAYHAWDKWWKVPRYDLSWEATGPLLNLLQLPRLEYIYAEHWEASSAPGLGDRVSASGSTALLAICSLILKLHAERKLSNA